MQPSTNTLMNPIKRLGLGILLGLSICASNFPTDAVAKGKVTEKMQVNKKAKHKAGKAEKVGKTAKKDKTSRHAKLAKKDKKSSKIAGAKGLRKTKTSRKSTSAKRKLARVPPENPYNITFVPNAATGEADTDTQAPGRLLQVGTASYYGDAFDGGRTASGERFDQDKLTCAHGSLPFGCKIRVTNLRNNRSVQVKVNDRGGFAKHGRVLDLSKAAAREIGMVNTGTAKVSIEVLQ